MLWMKPSGRPVFFGKGSEARTASKVRELQDPRVGRTRSVSLVILTVRFLFAYHDLGFPGPTVGRHEFTPRSKQRGNTVVPEALDASAPCADSLLRLSGNAAALTLLSSESSS